MTASNASRNFEGPVATITGVLQDSAFKPVSQAKVIMYSTTGDSAGVNVNVSNSGKSEMTFVRSILPVIVIEEAI